MSKVIISIPYQETVWGEVMITVNLPEGEDQETFVDAVQRGDIDVFTQAVINEQWEAENSEVIKIEYENLEVIQ